mmetsp:Transcript_66160/g.171650  ORF Transcript_66160/g.171650 Transcript_66160/m.171650 type:complete len:1146 (-) Transcript_66160:170-3607(-)
MPEIEELHSSDDDDDMPALVNAQVGGDAGLIAPVIAKDIGLKSTGHRIDATNEDILDDDDDLPTLDGGSDDEDDMPALVAMNPKKPSAPAVVVGEVPAAAVKPKSGTGCKGWTDFDRLDGDEDDDMPAIIDNTKAGTGMRQELPQKRLAGEPQVLPGKLAEQQPAQLASGQSVHEGDVDRTQPFSHAKTNDQSHPTEVRQAKVVPAPVRVPSAKASVAAAPEARADSEEARLLRRLQTFRDRGDKHGESGALLVLSELRLKAYRKDEAMIAAEEAKAAALEAGDKEREAEACRSIVRTLAAQDYLTKAEQTLKEAEDDVAQGPENQKVAAILLLAAADVRLEQARLKQVHRLTEQALTVFAEAADKKWMAVALELKATAFSGGEKVEMCLDAAGKALDLYRELGDNRREAAILRTISRACASKGDASQAIKKAQESQALCRELSDHKGEAAALECLAGAYLAKRDGAETALDMATRSVRICRQIKDARGEVAGLQIAVNAHMAMRDVEEALRVAKEAVEAARRDGDVGSIGSTLEMVINIHLQSELPQKALLAAEEEVALACESGNPQRQAIALQKVASVQAVRDQPKEALKKAEEARELLKKSGEKKAEAAACIVVADYLITQKKFDEAVEAAKQAESLHRELNNVVGIVHSLQIITSAYCEKEDKIGALKASWEQRDVYKDAGYKEEEGSTLLGIADFVNMAKGPREAMKPAQESRSIFQQVGDKDGEAGTLVNIAGIQMQLQLPTDALKSCKEAESIYKSLGDPFGQANALQMSANVYLMQQRSQEAVRVASEAREVLHKAGDVRAEALAWQVVCQVHLSTCTKASELGRNPDPRIAKDALRAADSALKLFREIEDGEGQAGALQMLADAHFFSGDADSSLRAARESLEVAESVSSAPAVVAALNSLAQAYMSMENYNDAMTAAQEASSIAREASDEQGYAIAQGLVKTLEDAMRPRGFSNGRFSRGFGGSSSGNGPSGRGGGSMSGGGGISADGGSRGMGVGSFGARSAAGRGGERSNPFQRGDAPAESGSGEADGAGSYRAGQRPNPFGRPAAFADRPGTGPGGGVYPQEGSGGGGGGGGSSSGGRPGAFRAFSNSLARGTAGPETAEEKPPQQAARRSGHRPAPGPLFERQSFGLGNGR